MADDLFSVNQGAMQIECAHGHGPDGQPRRAAESVQGASTRSSFDLELRQAGTYRIAVADSVVMARWEEDGKPKRWRGTAAEMASQHSRERGEARSGADAAPRGDFRHGGHAHRREGRGAEAASSSRPLQHPNDLYAKETAKFRFLRRRQARREISKWRSSPAARVTATRRAS